MPNEEFSDKVKYHEKQISDAQEGKPRTNELNNNEVEYQSSRKTSLIETIKSDLDKQTEKQFPSKNPSEEMKFLSIKEIMKIEEEENKRRLQEEKERREYEKLREQEEQGMGKISFNTVVNPRTMAKVVEPYYTCTVEEGLANSGLFPARSVQSFKIFLERVGPKMKALHENDREATHENFFYPIDDYFTLNGDGLLSICIRVHDDNKSRHKIATYNHVTRELKTLGHMPRHTFIEDVDASVVCMNDPPSTEGVIGALTHDSNFVVILAHSKGLRTLSVFDIVNATCLLQKCCTRVDFLNCGPSGIALNPRNVTQGRFEVGILTSEMEVRVWNATTLAEGAVQLENVWPGIYLSRYLINPRESRIKFTPDGRSLCVMAYLDAERHSACILMDSTTLEPFCMMPYEAMYSPFCSIFPCFTTCGSKFAMFHAADASIVDLERYKLSFYEIPPRLDSLKDLCRFSILSSVDSTVLNKLPLPKELINYLGGNMAADPSLMDDKKKQCKLM